MKNVIVIALCGLCAGACAGESVSLNGVWELSWRHEQEADAKECAPVAAEVPGEALLTLEKHGIVPPLEVGTNVWGVFAYEQMRWRYARSFARPALACGERARLRFDGVDTRAEYFLNGEKLGASGNMFRVRTFDVTEKLRATNRLEVVLHSPLGLPLLGVLGRSRVGGTDVETVRKAQHAFGWDILPRVVTCGLWRGVWLDVLPPDRFGDVHWMTMAADAKTRRAEVRVDCQILAPWTRLHNARLRVSLARGGRTVARAEHTVRFLQTRDTLHVRDAELWWPRGSGDAALYDATAELLDADGNTLARDTRRIGLRTVKLERADWRSEAEPGTFRFLVNGEPVYVRGANWTPMDALHARDGRHLERCLEMLTDLNCNMIRVWGGGVYEPERLFDFCDANGILVWQDFMMGNVPAQQDDAYAAEIYAEAKEVVVRYRSHPSLALWNGNNEVDRSTAGNMRAFAPEPNTERVSREVLPRVLRDWDPFRPYLPSSPYWTPDVAAGAAKLSQDHLWGPRLYYRVPYYTNSTVTFVSEMGHHGCPSVTSLRKMMTPEGVYPWPDASRPERFNAEWQCKSTQAFPDYPRGMGDGRNALMVKQVRIFFGSVPTNLEAFVECSQIVQAEACKYWIELFRARKGRTWGLVWWNLRDGWPVLSDSVVDYYFEKKKAYAAIKSVQGDQLALLTDAREIVAVNDTRRAVRGRVRATDERTGRTLFDGACGIAANGVTKVTDALPLAGNGFVRIEYTFDGVRRENRALYGEPPFDRALFK